MLSNIPILLDYPGAIMNAIISMVLNLKTLIPSQFRSRVPFAKCVCEQICTEIFGLYRRGCAIGGACEQRTEFTSSPH